MILPSPMAEWMEIGLQLRHLCLNINASQHLSVEVPIFKELKSDYGFCKYFLGGQTLGGKLGMNMQISGTINYSCKSAPFRETADDQVTGCLTAQRVYFLSKCMYTEQDCSVQSASINELVVKGALRAVLADQS